MVEWSQSSRSPLKERRHDNTTRSMRAIFRVTYFAAGFLTAFVVHVWTANYGPAEDSLGRSYARCPQAGDCDRDCENASNPDGSGDMAPVTAPDDRLLNIGRCDHTSCRD